MTLRCLTFTLATFLLALSGCVGQERHPAPASASPPADSLRADSIVRSLTLEEKVGQLFMPALYARPDSSTLQAVATYASRAKAGGVLLLKGDAAGVVAVHNMLVRESILPPWVAIDAEWGLGMRLDSLPVFPVNGVIAAGADSRMMYTYGSEVAREARALGINMVLGPVLDAPGGTPSAIGERAFSGSPSRVAELGTSYAEGLENGGVMSVAKHFPGLGGIMQDTHKELPVSTATLAHLDTVNLEPFRIYIDAGMSGVMVGHLAVPAIDYRVRPAALSPIVISDLLRGDLHFRGLVLTDALNMGANTEGDTGSVLAIAAGADIILAPSDLNKAIDNVVKAVSSGRLSPGRIDEACRRVIRYKLRFAWAGARPLCPRTAERSVRSKTYVADTLSRALRPAVTGAPGRRSCNSRRQ